MNKHLPKLLILLAVIAVAGLISYEKVDQTDSQVESGVLGDVESVTYAGEVYFVVDGDTAMVKIDGENKSVRILGIDTPETEHAPAGAECYGAEASGRARELLDKQNVTLTTDATQDTYDDYGRLLAYVTLPDGTDFGEAMITSGHAREYTFKGREYLKQTTYREAELIAKENQIGLWDECR